MTDLTAYTHHIASGDGDLRGTIKFIDALADITEGNMIWHAEVKVTTDDKRTSDALAAIFKTQPEMETEAEDDAPEPYEPPPARSFCKFCGKTLTGINNFCGWDCYHRYEDKTPNYPPRVTP